MAITFSRSDILKGIAASITGFAVFAIGDAVAKWLTQSYPIVFLVLFNGLFGAFFLGLINAMTGGVKRAFRTRKLKLHIIRSVVYSLTAFLVIYAFANLPMANVYAIIFAAPLITTALSAPLLKQHVGKREWAGVLAGFAGILVMLRPGLQPIDLATISALAGAFMFSTTSLMVSIISRDNDDHRMVYCMYPVMFQILAGILACLAAGFEIPQTIVVDMDMGLFLLSGLLGATGLYFVSTAFHIAPAAIVAPFHYSQMIWGVLLGYMIWNDIPDQWTLIGGFMIIASGLYIIQTQTRRQPAPVVASDRTAG